MRPPPCRVSWFVPELSGQPVAHAVHRHGLAIVSRWESKISERRTGNDVSVPAWPGIALIWKARIGHPTRSKEDELKPWLELREIATVADLALPKPGSGGTAARFAALARLGGEGPVACSIGRGPRRCVGHSRRGGPEPDPGATYGVWAARHVPAVSRRTWWRMAGTWRGRSLSAREARESIGHSSRPNAPTDTGSSTSRWLRTSWGSIPGRGPRSVWRIR